MNPSIIEVVDLTFDYPGFRALDHVNVSIAPGTVTALVGPNGAGKTTLLRCIAALNVPQSGTVRVAGLDVYESPREVHRLMGYLSDNFGLYSELTVAQGLDYAARSQGLATADVAQAVQATAQRMGLLQLQQPLPGFVRRQVVQTQQFMLQRLLLLFVPLRPTAELFCGRVEDAQVGRLALADSVRDVGVTLGGFTVALPYNLPRPCA